MLRHRGQTEAHATSNGQRHVTSNGQHHVTSNGQHDVTKFKDEKWVQRRGLVSCVGGGLKTLLTATLFVLYGVVPVWYGNCTWLRRNFIYLNAVHLVPELNMTQPMASGLACGRNFYLRSEEEIKVGVWHAVPRSLASRRCSNGTLAETSEFDDDRPVFLHLHGSGGTRGARHRVELHKMLTEKMDAHVVTLDYRGFGDSTPARPTVRGVVHDAATVYRWIRRRVSRTRIHLWAQSLGTGVAVHLASDLPQGEGPVSVVLESPYTSIPDASREHPYTILHTFFPFFDFWFVTPATHPDTNFDSERRIGNVTAPVLILHAQDDDTIPYKLGKKLFETAQIVRDPRRQPVKMVTYEGHLGYGHKSISSDPALPDLVREFMTSSRDIHMQTSMDAYVTH